MSDLRFAAPEWATAFWAVLAGVALLFWLERRGGRALARLVGPALQDRLVERATPLRRALRLGLLGMAGVALVLALMRPQWGVEFVTAPQVGAEIMIALDVSKSMLAEDVAPNRLERAKAEIRDLLPYLDGDQVGLIAFAGRASVLSPLTPDFGFLRLVLDSVDVGTVRRGGTRLEEPIRQATEGFGGSGDLSRVILLITDGEDHDSFPIEAAEEAAKQGIRIIAIGFGDEDGSPITLTDPTTGARATLRDAEGRPVTSRLDGDLLRELAVVTEGAYVPAGTGVLDLESIFEAHLRPLMRATGEERGRTIRKDGFQWFVLVALLCLFGSVATQATRAGLVAALLLAAQLPLAESAPAQAGPPPDDPAALGATAPTPDAGGDARQRLELPEDAREAFNRGLSALEAGELDDAERLFEAARGRSRGDAEVRFRATYNQGWIEVERAEAALDADPEAALASLERSADWFREAIALRPQNGDARRNLEIVLARALVLADALAERAPRDVEARLEELIEAQRGVAAGIREVVEQLQRFDDPEAAEALRPQLKRLAVEERKTLGLAKALADVAGEELDGIEALPAEERTPEQGMRGAQLTGLLQHLHRARERIGQARSQLRQRHADRAHRRAASALASLERGRDQLRDPIQALDAVLRDGVRLAGETRALANARFGVALRDDADAASPSLPVAPAWLDSPYLAEGQAEIGERTGELDGRLSAGLAPAEAVEDPQQRALLERVREAQPHVAAAAEHFDAALTALQDDRPQDALGRQGAAIEQLVRARERFLDLKRLIEVAYADEKRIQGFLEPDSGAEAGPLAELGPALQALQQQNLDRVRRMDPMIEEERAVLQAQQAAPDAAVPEGGADPQALERLELANGILALTEPAMEGAVEALGGLHESDAAAERAREPVATSLRGLESLRRLFFSIVEHLRDTAERQVELGDDTEQVAARMADASDAEIGPVASHQEELAGRTDELAQALHQQSLTDPAGLLGPEAAADEEAAAEATEKLLQASELVLFAGEEMKGAAAGLEAEPRDFAGIRERQTTAVAKLAEALALLQPPQQQQQRQQQENSQDQDEEQQQQAAQQAEAAQEQQPASDPAQLLQSVRDREAERHRRRGERRPRAGDPVGKDW